MPPDKQYQLSDEAKAEIAEAIRIVREDKFEAFVRGRVKPTTDPAAPGPGDPPPPKSGDPVPPAGDVKKKGLWWGEASELWLCGKGNLHSDWKWSNCRNGIPSRGMAGNRTCRFHDTCDISSIE